MPSDITVEADAFGAALEELSRCGEVVDEAIRPAVQKAGRTAKKEWQANAPKRTGRYAASISYTVKGQSHDTHMEAGSKTLPGLPHLLEKGHATIFEGNVDKAIDRALEAL